MIPDEVITEVLERADLVELVNQVTTVKKAGTLMKGCCPFHSENTPSFVVYPTQNTYHCFGCGAHGHSIKFVMETEGMSFPEAVRHLGARYGVAVPEPRRISEEEKTARKEKKSLEARLLTIQDRLTLYYSDTLYGPRGARGRQYLRTRSIKNSAVKAFRLGWATGDKKAMQAWLDEQEDASVADLELLGIVVKPEEGWDPEQPLGGGYLRFRERVMFPVIDLSGEVVGFSGRIIDKHTKAAKYINSPETPVYTKGDHLYGGWQAKQMARQSGRVIVCEGNLDVVALWQAGLQNACAALGTALTASQARKIKRLSSELYVVMDGDDAGRKAAFGSLLTFLEEGLQPRAVMLPTGHDPDTFLKSEGRQILIGLLEQASPLLDQLIEHLDTSHPKDPVGRAEALKAVVPAFDALSEPITRAMYLKKITTTFSVDEAMLDLALKGHRDQKRKEAERQAKREAAARRRKQAEGQEGSESTTELTPHDGFEHHIFDDGPYEETETDGFEGHFDMAAPGSMGPGGAGSPGWIDPNKGSAPPPADELHVVDMILQYPHVVMHFRSNGGLECLTHSGLAGFVSCLYDAVASGQVPNEDRLLMQIEERALSRTLAGFMERGPTQTEESITAAIDTSLRRLRARYLKRRKEEASQKLLDARASQDADLFRAAYDELKAATDAYNRHLRGEASDPQTPPQGAG
ncbi:MAG: DNA primase [Bradymonadia bacterium]